MLLEDAVIVPNYSVRIPGIAGWSAHRRVFLGYAQANLLHSISFADILDEDSGRGYQRRFNPKHSLDFRRYIQAADSTTIPLTFNLRPSEEGAWRVDKDGACAYLEIDPSAGKFLAQVDCQHRLGYLKDVEVTLPFMTFLGLSAKQEMEIFNIINSKAKGLSTSLLDFHDATLAGDLSVERPELFIALHLNNHPESPWYRQLDLGGATTSGIMRRASLRTMQKAIKRFLTQTRILSHQPAAVAARVVLDFWCAVAVVLRHEWDAPRHSLLNKGVGVYALMEIAGDLLMEGTPALCDKRFFIAKLGEFVTDIDWSTSGTLKGLGGESGVKSAVSILRTVRKAGQVRITNNGK